MGFRTDEEIQKRLNSPDNLPKRLEIHEHKIGRVGEEIPFEIKKVITGVANSSDETDKEVGKVFGVAHQTVSYYKNGTVCGTPNEELKAIAEGRKQDAADQAISILLEGLQILPGKLKGEKTKIVSSVCKDMAQVHETLRKKGPMESANIAFHLYAPPQKSVDDYEVIDV